MNWWHVAGIPVIIVSLPVRSKCFSRFRCPMYAIKGVWWPVMWARLRCTRLLGRYLNPDGDMSLHVTRQCSKHMLDRAQQNLNL